MGELCPFPAIFGHEGVGRILAIGSAVKDKTLQIGDRVLLSINYCQECRFCRAGHPADCTEGTRLHLHGLRDDGSTAARLQKTGEEIRFHFFGQSSFAQKSFVHETCIVKVPDEVKDDELPFLAAMGCGYQTGAGTVENILQPKKEDRLVIFGLGAVGLSALMAAKYMGVQQIVAVDVQEHKLPLAKDLGATDVVNSTQHPGIVAQIKSLSPSSAGVDFAIDCTGVPSVIETCLNVLAMRGTAATVGVSPAGSKVSVDPLAFLLGSKRYVGCREGDSNPKKYIPHLCEKVKEGKFPVEKLCRVYEYGSLEAALRDIREGRVVKGVIKW